MSDYSYDYCYCVVGTVGGGWWVLAAGAHPAAFPAPLSLVHLSSAPLRLHALIFYFGKPMHRAALCRSCQPPCSPGLPSPCVRLLRHAARLHRRAACRPVARGPAH